MDERDWAGFYSFSVNFEEGARKMQAELESKDNLINQQAENIARLNKQVEELKGKKDAQ